MLKCYYGIFAKSTPALSLTEIPGPSQEITWHTTPVSDFTHQQVGGFLFVLPLNKAIAACFFKLISLSAICGTFHQSSYVTVKSNEHIS